jgi:hypothetical protein
MSQKLQQILELLLSEENEKAEELLHEYVVSKARAQYESILDEENDDEIDFSNDFEDDITADELGENDDDMDDMEDMGDDDMTDDMGDDDLGDMGDDDMGDDMDGDLEDKVSELEDELESLKADFAALMGGDEGEMDDMGDDDMTDMDDDMEDMGDEEMMDSVEYDLDEEEEVDEDEVVEEATNFSNKVAHPKAGATEKTDSPFTNPPKHTTVSSQGKPVHIKDGGTGKMSHNGGVKKNTASDNMNVKPVKAAMPKKGE